MIIASSVDMKFNLPSEFRTKLLPTRTLLALRYFLWLFRILVNSDLLETVRYSIDFVIPVLVDSCLATVASIRHKVELSWPIAFKADVNRTQIFVVDTCKIWHLRYSCVPITEIYVAISSTLKQLYCFLL